MIFPVSSVSRPALGPTQPPVKWVPEVLSPGVKRGRGVTLTTHPHLVPRSWMSRSYTSPPKNHHGVWRNCFNLVFDDLRFQSQPIMLKCGIWRYSISTAKKVQPTMATVRSLIVKYRESSCDLHKWVSGAETGRLGTTVANWKWSAQTWFDLNHTCIDSTTVLCCRQRCSARGLRGARVCPLLIFGYLSEPFVTGI
jgi:hypothetical protein